MVYVNGIGVLRLVYNYRDFGLRGVVVLGFGKACLDRVSTCVDYDNVGAVKSENNCRLVMIADYVLYLVSVAVIGEGVISVCRDRSVCL